jgi:predicted DNA-binding transcriptional regulator AlpA
MDSSPPPLDHLDRDQLFAVIVNASARLNALANNTVAKEEPAPVAAPAPTALTFAQLAARLQVSRATLYRLRADKNFPQPAYLSPRQPRWLLAEVLLWERGKHHGK